MPDDLKQDSVPLSVRQDLIKTFPCFVGFTAEQCSRLAELMQVVHYSPNEGIVTEDEYVDSIYIIVAGHAEVTRESQQKKKIIAIPLAVIEAGDSIGLNDTGFYSVTGKRTATVTAITDITVLKLELKELDEFLKKYNLEVAMHAASQQMLRMQFIKQSLPFTHISHERLQWLTDRVEETTLPAGAIIFKQGEEGDKCYLIRSGKVEIVSQHECQDEHRLAVLNPPVLFGEATLITHSPRNATARTLEPTALLILQHQHLSELIESENNVANMFMTLMVDRSRPSKNPRVSQHQTITADGQELTILKNPDNGSYFKLSAEGAFIWQALDGKQTLPDITLDLAEQYKVFAPNMVAALISKLSQAGFISNLDIPDDGKLSTRPLWVRAMLLIKRIAEARITIGDADAWVTRCYDKYVRYLFTKPGQIILAFIAIAGLFAFIFNTSDILLFFSYKHASLLLILGLIPLSAVEVILHELGHAFTVKAFGREVHYIGIGWYWFGPIAFTDTSDMWLSPRKPRMLVNCAGIYVDILVAGLCALAIFIIDNPYVQSMLWLFALYTYIGGFRMLSPLQEMDGYYLLMDWVEKNHLRQQAVRWLLKPRFVVKHKAEITYWVACLLYLIAVTILTLIVQTFIFSILELSANPYVSLILPFLVVVISSLNILADIRNQAEE